MRPGKCPGSESKGIILMKKILSAILLSLGLGLAPIPANLAAGAQLPPCSANHDNTPGRPCTPALTPAAPPTYQELQADYSACRDTYFATLQEVVREHDQIVHKNAVIARLRHRLQRRG